MNKTHSTTAALLGLFALAATTFTASMATAQEPSLKGWSRTPAREYKSGIDPEMQRNGKPSAFMESMPGKTLGFGTLSKFFKAEDYVGKRVQFKGFMKTLSVSGTGAGLWLRIDSANMEPLGFDNMSERSLKGTTDWTEVSVVLDVPANANGIAMGVLLVGTGRSWVNGLTFEVVDKSVPVTVATKTYVLPKGPGKLDFTE